jgi:hypothetical protein
VFVNRQLLRPTEFSVNGNVLTFNVDLIASDDEIEITGIVCQ